MPVNSATTVGVVPAGKPQLASQVQSLYAAHRPWRLFFDISAFSFPLSYSDATARTRQNVNHFRVNYTLIVLIIVFCSLVYHPISMVVLLVASIAWISLYFCRDDPIVVSGRIVDDRIVLVGLSFATVMALAFTHVGSNVLVSLIVGVAVIGLHAAFRGTEELFLDESDAGEGGLLSVVRGESNLYFDFGPEFERGRAFLTCILTGIV